MAWARLDLSQVLDSMPKYDSNLLKLSLESGLVLLGSHKMIPYLRLDSVVYDLSQYLGGILYFVVVNIDA